MLTNGIVLSTAAGVFAALAAFFSKLAFGSKELVSLDFEIRVVSVGMVVVCNVLMWLLFVRSLHSTPSVVIAMIFNTTSNFITTGILGHLIFGEELKFTWLLGILFMIFGILLLKQGSTEKT